MKHRPAGKISKVDIPLLRSAQLASRTVVGGVTGSLVGAAAGTTVAVTDTARTVLAVVPRVEALLNQVEELVQRIQAVAAGAEDAVTRTHAVIDEADAAVARTNATLGAGEASLRQTQAMLTSGGALMERADGLLTQYEQPAQQLLPLVQTFADTLDPHEVEAAIKLIDRLPDLLMHVEDDLLPMLRSLDRVGPDIHEILDVVEDLRRVFTGLPGIGRLRRRADVAPPEVHRTRQLDGPDRS